MDALISALSYSTIDMPVRLDPPRVTEELASTSVVPVHTSTVLHSLSSSSAFRRLMKLDSTRRSVSGSIRGLTSQSSVSVNRKKSKKSPSVSSAGGSVPKEQLGSGSLAKRDVKHALELFGTSVSVLESELKKLRRQDLEVAEMAVHASDNARRETASGKKLGNAAPDASMLSHSSENSQSNTQATVMQSWIVHFERLAKSNETATGFRAPSSSLKNLSVGVKGAKGKFVSLSVSPVFSVAKSSHYFSSSNSSSSLCIISIPGFPLNF